MHEQRGWTMDENPYAPPTGDSAPESKLNPHRPSMIEIVGANWIGTGLFAMIALGLTTGSAIPAIGGFVFAVMLNIAFVPVIFAAWLLRNRWRVTLPVELISATWGGVCAFAGSLYLFDVFQGWLIASASEPIAVPVVTLLGACWNVALVRFIGWWSDGYGSNKN
jgi:hypothetical protein